jgi:hypothetical protein
MRVFVRARGTYAPPEQLEVALVHGKPLQRPVVCHHSLHVVRIDVVREQPCGARLSSFREFFDQMTQIKQSVQENTRAEAA